LSREDQKDKKGFLLDIGNFLECHIIKEILDRFFRELIQIYFQRLSQNMHIPLNYYLPAFPIAKNSD